MNDREVLTISPSIEFLQWLARGSLKQHISLTLRFWVWLRVLYGEANTRLNLPDPFRFPDWRDAFFASDHPKSESAIAAHSPDCPCYRSGREWLQWETTDFDLVEWQESLLKQVRIPCDRLEAVLDRPLFAVTRRSLQNDLAILHELGWLQRNKQYFSLVADWPQFPVLKEIPALLSHSLPLANEDLDAIATSLAPTEGQTSRFFLHLDYVVGRDDLDRVDDRCEELKRLWHQNPVPPIRLSYRSAILQKIVKPIVYPVCLYYTYRALYLCAYGETSGLSDRWCHWRLDRVSRIAPLTWQNANLPTILWEAYLNDTLPTPNDIEIEFAKAWGFYFYKPAATLILRFERQFHDNYIANSNRHDTFQKLLYREVYKYILENCRDRAQQQYYDKILTDRSPYDAYYRAEYRVDDVNIWHRLRSWRPLSEVLWPPKLREQMRNEANQEAFYYSDPEDL